MHFTELENYVNEANTKNTGQILNNISMPTQASAGYKHFVKRKHEMRSERLKSGIDKYGGEEFLNVPEDVLFNAHNSYVEYNSNGKVKKIVEKPNAFSSIYPEDVHINGHSSIWGSFFHDDFGWGYKCCLSFEKNRFCQGPEGREENKCRIVSINYLIILLIERY